MKEHELIQWENEIYTKIVIDELKKQRAAGKTEFLLDRCEMERMTREQLKRLLQENRTTTGS